ncbi:MAG TPA: alpha/beta hydrolase [Candidatus Paceibacterota bacterium]
MKLVVIVHCWAGVPDSRWYPYVKHELEKSGDYKVEVPAMPSTNHPKFDSWITKLNNIIGTPNTDLFLVGHSLGGPTIMRYLESLPENVRIGGVVLVAVPTDTLDNVPAIEDKSVLPDFFGKGVDWKKIKNSAREFIGIYSDNDPYIDVRHADVIKEKLEARIIMKHGLGHMSEPDGEGDTVVVKELPDVVVEIKRMAGIE